MKILFILLIILKIADLKTILETKENYWNNFKLNFKKSYDSQKDDDDRKEIFWNNLKTISRHNFKYCRGQSTFKMGINKFADMTFQEFSNMFKANETVKQNSQKFLDTHTIVPDFKVFLMGSQSDSILNQDDLPFPFTFRNKTSEIPKSFDWREKGAVTPVKDQMTCGSCYAMSTIASVEGQLFIKTGKLVQLSEQEILDCSSEYGTFGCQGGIGFRVFDYIKDNEGISSSQDYPYEQRNGECRRYGRKKVEINFVGYGIANLNDDEALLEAIIEYGPVMVSIDSDHESFMFYSSGVYYEEKCTEDINHGVTAVGFGSENGDDYWIVKNSFGDQWGESGYIRIKRGTNKDCSLNSIPLFPILKD